MSLTMPEAFQSNRLCGAVHRQVLPHFLPAPPMKLAWGRRCPWGPDRWPLHSQELCEGHHSQPAGKKPPDLEWLAVGGCKDPPATAIPSTQRCPDAPVLPAAHCSRWKAQA